VPYLPWVRSQPPNQFLQAFGLGAGQPMPFSEIGEKRRDRSVEIALDETLDRVLEQLGRRRAGAVAIHAVGEAASEMPFPSQALHHREHRRPREATRCAEMLDRFRDRCAAPVGDVTEEGEFLFAYR